MPSLKEAASLFIKVDRADVPAWKAVLNKSRGRMMGGCVIAERKIIMAERPARCTLRSVKSDVRFMGPPPRYVTIESSPSSGSLTRKSRQSYIRPPGVQKKEDAGRSCPLAAGDRVTHAAGPHSSALRLVSRLHAHSVASGFAPLIANRSAIKARTSFRKSRRWKCFATIPPRGR